MLDAAIEGLVLAMQWPAVGYLGLGIMLGLYFGAVPGLGGLTGMAILLPFTFGMDPVSAFAFLLGMYAVTTTSDSITAILIGVPGTAAAQATVLDGYPMAQRGEAARAFGAAFMSSAIGGVLGGFFMGLSIPIVRPLVLSFAKPEFFMLGVLGLMMVGSLSGKSVLKGVISAIFGLVLSMIGYAEQVAIPRYWAGIGYLLDGLNLIPFVLGLFALPELINLAVKDRPISTRPREAVRGGMMQGVRDCFVHWWLLLRSTVIGIYIGVLPALGPTIADWVAYGHAVQSAKDRSMFGKGDVRGVIAPEAANNSVKGGDLVPTVAFGIPGSAGMAILLGAFLIQGLTPGPEMLTTKLPITFSMMWNLVIANIVAAVLLMMWTNQLQRIIFIPSFLVVPAITLFMFMGAWTGNAQLGDWVVLLIFGVIGIAMKLGGWPRAPMILGFILGPIMENSLHISVKAYGLDWLGRPIVLVLMALTIITLALAVRSQLRERRRKDSQMVSDADSEHGGLSFGVSVLVTLAFVYAIVGTFAWPDSVRRWPLAIAVPGLLLVLWALARDALVMRRTLAGASGIASAMMASAAVRQETLRTIKFFFCLVAIVAATVVVGQQIALTAFMLLFLLFWAKWDWRKSLIYAALGWACLYGVFEELVKTNWYPSLLF